MQWRGRAREYFDRCKRKIGITFPEEARGWILLQCSGMNEEQRAVVLARIQGELKFDTMSQSMRSYFPDFVVWRKKSIYVYLVESKIILKEDESLAAIPDDMDSQDVELFLAKYGGDNNVIDVTKIYEMHDTRSLTFWQ